jgi:MFS family permease
MGDESDAGAARPVPEENPSPPPPAPAPAAEGAHRRSSPWNALKVRDFRLYWTGQTISLIGTWMQAVALNLVIVTLTKRNRDLGLLQIASSAPMVVLTLFGGAIADRGDRRKILIVTQIALMLLAFAFAGLVYWGTLTLPIIMGIAFLSGTAAAFDLPASQALAPQLVPPHQIPEAIALIQSAFHGSRVLGPALAGALIAPLGFVGMFTLNGLSFLAVIFTLVVIRPVDRRKARPPGAGAAAISEGLSYVWHRKDARAMVTLSALNAIFVFPFMIVLMVAFLTHVIGADKRDFAITMATSGVGAFIGAITLLRVPPEQRQRRIFFVAMGIGVMLAAVSFTRWVPLTAACVCVLGYCTSTTMGLVSTILQSTVPDELRGRVMSINMLLFIGLMPLAALGGGALSDAVGLPWVMLGSAALYLVLATTVLVRAGFARRVVSSG